MDVQSSTLGPNGTAYAIDPLIAGVMLIRRDVTVEDRSEPKTDQYGVRYAAVSVVIFRVILSRIWMMWAVIGMSSSFELTSLFHFFEAS